MFALAALALASVAAAGSVPAISRPLSQLIHNDTDSSDVVKRSYCVYGYEEDYQCCNSGYYCLSSETCETDSETSASYCCPAGTTFDQTTDECKWSDGSEETPYDQIGSYYNYYTYTTPSYTYPGTPLSYYESICTISWTYYYGEWDYALETSTLTSTDYAETSTLAINTDNEADASSYFTMMTSYMSSASTSWATMMSSSLLAEGVFPAAVVTLGGASDTGAVATASTTGAAMTTAKPSASGKTSGSAASSMHTTTGSANATASASGSAVPSANPSNAAGALRSSGVEMLVGAALTVFALGSGLSAVLL